MKADDGGTQFQQQAQGLVALVEGRIDFRQGGRHRNAGLRKQRRQVGQPGRFTGCVAARGAWQNTFTLKGWPVRARVSAIIWRACAGVPAPMASEPSAPALATAATRPGVATPAIGAWMSGCRTESCSKKFRDEDMRVSFR
ncbi:hypothetical protein JaAD80_12390 [Janthinobacterium sp. AD80]|nr:hypothetical protein JaAD80_12390 [Janthinobacterium sp. AD80]